MTLHVKHGFVSPKADGTDPTVVKPSAWNADHNLTTDSSLGILLGRASGTSGAIQELVAPFKSDGTLSIVPIANARFEAVGDFNLVGTSNANTPMPYAATIFNNNGGAFAAIGGPGGGHKWTPGAGTWLIQAGTLLANAASTTTGYGLGLYLNGVGLLGGYNALATVGDANTMIISALCTLAATDYVNVMIAISGTDGSYHGNGPVFTFLQGFRVG